MTKTTPPKTPSRASIRRARLFERGLVSVELHVPPSTKHHLKALETLIQEGSPVGVFPPKYMTAALQTGKGVDLMTEVDNWTVTSLYRALTDGDYFDSHAISFDMMEGAMPHIVVDFKDLDAKAPLLIVGEQILISLLLMPVDAVPDEAATNRRMLEIHKMLPLSTIGITYVNGRAFYELFGALSAKSALTSVVTEIAVLAENYQDVLDGLTVLNAA